MEYMVLKSIGQAPPGYGGIALVYTFDPAVPGTINTLKSSSAGGMM